MYNKQIGDFMLKKFVVLSLILFSTSIVWADNAGTIDAEKKGHFSVKSDHRSFNPFNASYTLKGNVVAKFPNRQGYVEIRADKAVAHFFTQKIKATGNVELHFNETFLRCDEAQIFNKQKKAYLYRNVIFKNEKDKITAPEARYDWREKIANFVDASRNGAPVIGNIVLEI